jgi:hypothetical protein
MDKESSIKFYVAGRFSDRERIRKTMDLIEERGGEITYDWTKHTPISPYHQNPQTAAEYSQGDIRGVTTCNILIIALPESPEDRKFGTGTSAELGAALAMRESGHDNPRIIMVGDKTEPDFPLMIYHHAVEWSQSIEEALEIVGLG